MLFWAQKYEETFETGRAEQFWHNFIFSIMWPENSIKPDNTNFLHVELCQGFHLSPIMSILDEKLIS